MKIFIAPKSRMQDVFRFWKLQHEVEEAHRAVERHALHLLNARARLAPLAQQERELSDGLEVFRAD